MAASHVRLTRQYPRVLFGTGKQPGKPAQTDDKPFSHTDSLHALRKQSKWSRADSVNFPEAFGGKKHAEGLHGVDAGGRAIAGQLPAAGDPGDSGRSVSARSLDK